MSGYEINVSITALCPCCGQELPSNAYTTKSRPSEGASDRDNPLERTDRRVFITPCAICFVPLTAVAKLIEAADEVLYELRDKSEAKAALIAALKKVRGK